MSDYLTREFAAKNQVWKINPSNISEWSRAFCRKKITKMKVTDSVMWRLPLRRDAAWVVKTSLPSFNKSNEHYLLSSSTQIRHFPLSKSVSLLRNRLCTQYNCQCNFTDYWWDHRVFHAFICAPDMLLGPHTLCQVCELLGQNLPHEGHCPAHLILPLPVRELILSRVEVTAVRGLHCFLALLTAYTMTTRDYNFQITDSHMTSDFNTTTIIVSLNYTLQMSSLHSRIFNWALLSESESESESYVTTDSQSASLSWNKAPTWGLRPDTYSSLSFTVLFLWVALSYERAGLSFVYVARPRQRRLSWVRVPSD
jgi:hypothetical protein